MFRSSFQEHAVLQNIRSPLPKATFYSRSSCSPVGGILQVHQFCDAKCSQEADVTVALTAWLLNSASSGFQGKGCAVFRHGMNTETMPLVYFTDSFNVSLAHHPWIGCDFVFLVLNC